MVTCARARHHECVSFVRCALRWRSRDVLVTAKDGTKIPFGEYIDAALRGYMKDCFEEWQNTPDKPCSSKSIGQVRCHGRHPFAMGHPYRVCGGGVVPASVARATAYEREQAH